MIVKLPASGIAELCFNVNINGTAVKPSRIFVSLKRDDTMLAFDAVRNTEKGENAWKAFINNPATISNGTDTLNGEIVIVVANKMFSPVKFDAVLTNNELSVDGVECELPSCDAKPEVSNVAAGQPEGASVVNTEIEPEAPSQPKEIEIQLQPEVSAEPEDKIEPEVAPTPVKISIPQSRPSLIKSVTSSVSEQAEISTKTPLVPPSQVEIGKTFKHTGKKTVKESKSLFSVSRIGVVYK